MRGSEALGILRQLGRPFFSTQEASLAMGVSSESATQLLGRLSDQQLLGRIRQGQWAIDPQPRPMAYATWITSPAPAYVSLYTALRQHGLIEQVPSIIYVVSLARTQRVSTAIGEYSVHQIAPALFGGYLEVNGFWQATPEKALFDTLYLARARSEQFTGLPEVELPVGFHHSELEIWAQRIADPAARARVEKTIADFLARH